jgi:hypothetical protein
MTLHVRSKACADIAPGRIHAVMEPPLRDRSEFGRRRRRYNNDRLRMRTPGQAQWEQHCCE